jgi:hypothetical protein
VRLAVKLLNSVLTSPRMRYLFYIAHLNKKCQAVRLFNNTPRLRSQAVTRCIVIPAPQ